MPFINNGSILIMEGGYCMEESNINSGMKNPHKKEVDYKILLFFLLTACETVIAMYTYIVHLESSVSSLTLAILLFNQISQGVKSIANQDDFQIAFGSFCSILLIVNIVCGLVMIITIGIGCSGIILGILINLKRILLLGVPARPIALAYYYWKHIYKN